MTLSRNARLAAPLAVAIAALATIVPSAAPAGAQEIPDEPMVASLEVVPGSDLPLGAQLALTATVGWSSGEPATAGVVQFQDGDAVVATATLGPEGRAWATYVPTTAGVHTLTASYRGAPPDFDPTTSVAQEVTMVAGGAVVVPEVGVTVIPGAEAPAGTGLELVATVGDPLEDSPVGTVAFLDRGVVVGTAELATRDGVVEARTTYTPEPGVRELAARYLGDLPATSPSSSAVVAFNARPETCAEHAVPGAGAIVRLAYLTVLHRCPDRGGFAYWTGRLEGGVSVRALGHALVLSAEGVGATVDQAYRRVLDRPADAGGRAVWAAKLRAGWTISQLTAALAASPEFASGAPGPDPMAAVVERAFARIIGRPVDDASLTYWAGRLSASPSRSAPLRALILTPEAVGVVIDDAFRAVLGRPAAPVDQVAGQVAIKARRGDWRTLAAGLLDRASGRSHAQTYPELDG